MGGPSSEIKTLRAKDIKAALDMAVDAATMARIREELDALPTLRKIDVVDLAEADEGFRNSVLKQGETVD